MITLNLRKEFMEKIGKRPPATEAIAAGYYRFNLPLTSNPREVDQFVSVFKNALRQHAEASTKKAVRESILHWLSDTPTADR